MLQPKTQFSWDKSSPQTAWIKNCGGSVTSNVISKRVPVSTPIQISQVETALQNQLQKRPQYAQHCDLRLLAHGEANLIFRLNNHELVRVAVNTPNKRFGDDFSRLTQFEKTILNYLEGTGIGHELHDAQTEPLEDFPYTFLITNYLDGRSLDYSRADLEKAATTLARLHRLPLDPDYDPSVLIPIVPKVNAPLTLFYQEAKDYAQPYLEDSSAEPEIVEMIHTILERAKRRLPTERWLIDYPHVCLVHSDHTYENWVIGDDRAFLVDWEWAEVGSPAGDLGHFLSPVTVRRRQDYRLPDGDRAFFLDRYYDALEDQELANRIERHFAAFGPFPALRSFCWTAGYWITANRWYEDAADSPSAKERLRRLNHSRQIFPEFYHELIAWFDEES